MEKPKFNNIVLGTFVVTEQERTPKSVVVSMFTSGKIKVDGFSLIQFMYGAMLDANKKDIDGVKLVGKIDLNLIDLDLKFKLLAKLQEAHFNLNNIRLRELKETFIEISREELLQLKKWLEFRMIHCEKERDERDSKFNPDTYIGQKVLLLDLRGLLLGEII